MKSGPKAHKETPYAQLKFSNRLLSGGFKTFWTTGLSPRFFTNFYGVFQSDCDSVADVQSNYPKLAAPSFLPAPQWPRATTQHIHREQYRHCLSTASIKPMNYSWNFFEYKSWKTLVKVESPNWNGMIAVHMVGCVAYSLSSCSKA